MAKHVCPMAKFVWSMAMLLPPIRFHQKQTLYIRPERLILLIGEIQSSILVINWDSVSMMCQKCVSKVRICVIIIFLVKNTFVERWPRQITKWAQSLLFKITYQAFLKIRNNHVSISCHMVYSHVIYVTWKLKNYKKTNLFKFEDLRF